MARKPRLVDGGVPVHVVKRGNNRNECFCEIGEFDHYLYLIDELRTRHGCAVHAYVLMTNHVHLLITPETAAGLSAFMKEVSQRYAQRFNLRHGRTGTLWEGRYRSARVDTSRHLLECYRYIELNPVRAGMVGAPADYRWSSHRFNGHGVANALITPHPDYLGLGADATQRHAAYRAFVAEPVDTQTLDEIRFATRGLGRIGAEHPGTTPTSAL